MPVCCIQYEFNKKYFDASLPNLKPLLLEDTDFLKKTVENFVDHFEISEFQKNLHIETIDGIVVDPFTNLRVKDVLQDDAQDKLILKITPPFVCIIFDYKPSSFDAAKMVDNIYLPPWKPFCDALDIFAKFHNILPHRSYISLMTKTGIPLDPLSEETIYELTLPSESSTIVVIIESPKIKIHFYDENLNSKKMVVIVNKWDTFGEALQMFSSLYNAKLYEYDFELESGEKIQIYCDSSVQDFDIEDNTINVYVQEKKN